jgi:hypothetical protein
MRTQFTEEPDVQGMGKRVERVVKYTHLFINTQLGHHLPVIELSACLE